MRYPAPPYWLRHCIRSLSLLVAASTVAVPALLAQSYSHYWAHQFGREGLFLSGAVIAGPEDNTAAIYNPGALGFSKGKGIGLSFLSGGVSFLNLRNALGAELDIKHTSVFVLPKFLAFDLPLLKKSKGHLVFTLYHKDFAKLRQNFRESFPVPEDPTREEVNTFNLEKNQKETWAGLAFAYPLSPSLSAGVTLLIPHHTQEYQFLLRDERYSPVFPGMIERYQHLAYAFNYSLFALQAKFGLAWRPENIPPLQLGATLTTPSLLTVAARGDYHYRFTEYSDSPPAGLPPQPFQFDNASLKAPAVHKWPLSIGAGFRYAFPGLSIYGSAEHFFRIAPYVVIEPDPDPPINSIPPEEWPSYPLYSKSDAITNAAFGLEVKVKEGVNILGGFQTDFNYYQGPIALEGEEFVVQTFNTSFNVYHISLGTSLLKNRNELSIGLRYSFSFQNDVLALGDLTNPDALAFDFIRRDQATADVRYNSVSVAITYNFFKVMF